MAEHVGAENTLFARAGRIGDYHVNLIPVNAGPGGFRGKFMAWDPVAKKEVWGIKENFPCWGGAVVTAGDVAFYGTMDRHFKAVHARTGKVLWDFETDSGIICPATTFKGPDGKQYVAVAAGSALFAFGLP